MLCVRRARRAERKGGHYRKGSARRGASLPSWRTFWRLHLLLGMIAPALLWEQPARIDQQRARPSPCGGACSRPKSCC